MNIVSKPHMRHGMKFVSSEQKQRAERAAKAEVNYAGVPIPTKNVIKLHESFVDGKLPTTESIKSGILDFYAEHGRKPTKLAITSHSVTTWISVFVPEIPGPWPMVPLDIVQGEFVELR